MRPDEMPAQRDASPALPAQRNVSPALGTQLKCASSGGAKLPPCNGRAAGERAAAPQDVNAALQRTRKRLHKGRAPSVPEPVPPKTCPHCCPKVHRVPALRYARACSCSAHGRTWPKGRHDTVSRSSSMSLSGCGSSSGTTGWGSKGASIAARRGTYSSKSAWGWGESGRAGLLPH